MTEWSAGQPSYLGQFGRLYECIYVIASNKVGATVANCKHSQSHFTDQMSQIKRRTKVTFLPYDFTYK